MSLEQRERAKYEKAWSDPAYATWSPGLRSVGRVLEYCENFGIHQVAVLGCGSGRAALTLARLRYRVELFDLTDRGLLPEARLLPFKQGTLWRLPYEDRAWPLVYCADVLEHLPPEKVDESLAEIARVTGAWALLQISCRESKKLDGVPLHLTVKKPRWWLERIEEAGLRVVNQDFAERARNLFVYAEASL